MCRELKVSRSGYYNYCAHKISKRSKENTKLREEIKSIYEEKKGRYGSPRICAELKARGTTCGKHRVARLMQEEGLRGKASRRKKWNPHIQEEKKKIPTTDYLKRNFKIASPNKAWVSDITYIATKEGWLYLCIVLDLFSRKIIRYKLSPEMESEKIVQVFEEAIALRKPEAGLIFHTDRGMQYVSNRFQSCLERYGALSSMSRKGNCFDNAVAESFFHTLKTELIERGGYSTREEARRKIFEYLFVFYNNKRRHSYLGYKTPTEFEQQFGDT